MAMLLRFGLTCDFGVRRSAFGVRRLAGSCRVRACGELQKERIPNVVGIEDVEDAIAPNAKRRTPNAKRHSPNAKRHPLIPLYSGKLLGQFHGSCRSFVVLLLSYC
jgi:hypothetical protein